MISSSSSSEEDEEEEDEEEEEEVEMVEAGLGVVFWWDGRDFAGCGGNDDGAVFEAVFEVVFEDFFILKIRV